MKNPRRLFDCVQDRQGAGLSDAEAKGNILMKRLFFMFVWGYTCF